MSIKITRKGLWRLNVNGAFFSGHMTPDEGYEKASEALDVAPGAAVVLQPPLIAIAAGKGTVTVPVDSPPPVLSDKGEDIIDFIARVANRTQPDPDGEVMVGTGDIHKDIDALVERSKTKILLTPIYADVDGDGKVEWVGLAWRGYGLEWWQRVKGAINIGV